jgi:hypothetical protein
MMAWNWMRMTRGIVMMLMRLLMVIVMRDGRAALGGGPWAVVMSDRSDDRHPAEIVA